MKNQLPIQPASRIDTNLGSSLKQVHPSKYAWVNIGMFYICPRAGVDRVIPGISGQTTRLNRRASEDLTESSMDTVSRVYHSACYLFEGLYNAKEITMSDTKLLATREVHSFQPVNSNQAYLSHMYALNRSNSEAAVDKILEIVAMILKMKGISNQPLYLTR